MTRQRQHRPGRKARGFSLVEALVALLVLSIGLLGIAALYVESLGASRTAQFRTQAINLAADMADRIRVNRGATVAYAGAAADNGCDGNAGAPAECTPAQMAAHDLFRWRQTLARLLPNGNGAVQVDAATVPPTYIITVTWAESGQAADLNYVMTVQM
jgi:type IV pilus assembly protein PilV